MDKNIKLLKKKKKFTFITFTTILYYFAIQSIFPIILGYILCTLRLNYQTQEQEHKHKQMGSHNSKHIGSWQVCPQISYINNKIMLHINSGD